MNALVTLVEGARYQRRFQRYCYPNWAAYASRYGLDIVVLDKALDTSPRARSRSSSWQKCLAVTDARVQKYDQIVWIDSDIVINAQRAPNIFDFFKAEEIAAVKDFDYPTREQFRATLESLYRNWDKAGMHYISNLTPEEFYTAFPLPSHSEVVHCGVIGLSPAKHAHIFRTAYDKYEDKGQPEWNYEMRPLSHEILSSSPVTWLDHRFNLILGYVLSAAYPYVMDHSGSLLERVKTRLGMPSTRKKKLKAVLPEILENAFFLHFAGVQSDMELLNNNPLTSADARQVA